MKSAALLLPLLLSCMVAYAQKFEADTIQYSGDITKRINLVILSDGYQQHELSRFTEDAKKFSDAFFAESPYKEYQNYFNVFAIKVPSNESGANHPGTATDVTEPDHPVKEVDNYFGSTFDYYNIHRLLVPINSSAISNVLATNFPSYDLVLILTNSPYYGGSGGAYATASLHSSSTEIAIHEIGHAFARLNDEYYAGDGYAREAYNMTQETSPSAVKWKNWYSTNEIGIYQHCCGGNSATWYRPHQNCKMRYLGQPFCAVCIEATIETVHSLVSPVKAHTPTSNTIATDFSPLKLELGIINPLPNTLKINWLLNGDAFESNTEFVSISANSIKKGLNTLTATIQDTTQLLRVNGHEDSHTYSVSWTLQNSVSGTSASLSALALSSGTLSPAFAPETTDYTATVSEAVTNITTTPTAQDITAALMVNGTAVYSGTASASIPLNVGSNTILIEIASEDGLSHKRYTIHVVREGTTEKATPDITFNNESRPYSSETFDLAASSNSTGAITYHIAEEQTASYPGDLSLSGTGNKTVRIIKSGKVKLKAIVAEDDRFLSDSSEMDLTISKATASVVLRELNHEFTGEPKSAAVSTEPAGLTTEVHYNGTATAPVAIGEYEVSAVVLDENYAGEASAILTISTPTAVFDPELAKSIKLYPNPTTGKARLELKEYLKEVDISIMNIFGQTISQGVATGSHDINLEGFAAGMYLISVKSKGKAVVTFKLEKL